MGPFVLGITLSGLIGYLGYAKGALTRSGVLGAMLVGTLIFWLGGWDWGMVLVAFFLSSSLLSRYREAEKERLAEKFAKGHQRDLGQALANGGLGALLAVGSAMFPSPLWVAGYIGCMATVTADTWATELGVLGRRKPRLITTGREVEIGTSGGVSWLGTGATVGGGLFIGLLMMVLRLLAGDQLSQPSLLLLGAALGGLLGSLFDSLLGATVQVIYHCDQCAKETERTLHRCGTETRQLRGWLWLNNDLVNLISSAVGAAVAAILFALLQL